MARISKNGKRVGRPPKVTNTTNPAPATAGALALDTRPAQVVSRRTAVFLDHDVAELLAEYPDPSATIRSWVTLSQRRPMARPLAGRAAGA